MAAQILGELEAAEVVGAREPPQDARLGEDGEAAIGGALGQAVIGALPPAVGRFEDLGDRQRAIGRTEHLDEDAPPRV